MGKRAKPKTSKLGNGTYGIQQSSKFLSLLQCIAPLGKLMNFRNSKLSTGTILFCRTAQIPTKAMERVQMVSRGIGSHLHNASM